MGPGHTIYSRKSSLDAGGFAEESGIVLVRCLEGSAADRVATARAHASPTVSASCHCNQNFCLPSMSDTHLQIRRAPRSAATWFDVIWSILRRTVTKLWWNVFISLVHDNMLNRTDPIHLECIRLCFLPVVQCHLDTLKDTWNHHRMRANRRNDKLSAIAIGVATIGARGPGPKHFFTFFRAHNYSHLTVAIK